LVQMKFLEKAKIQWLEYLIGIHFKVH
jgi:hypothetical protein